ncbi:hypothetical protein PG995_013277 [Apiospora arundinis]
MFETHLVPADLLRSIGELYPMGDLEDPEVLATVELEMPGPRRKYYVSRDLSEESRVEDAERYEPGGFHPVEIGDRFGGGRFRVAHKLGYGGFTTVWLCRDEQKDRWCALKIMATDDSSEEGGDLKVMKRFREKGIDWQEAAAHYVVLPEEHFWIEGPNGRHLALVTPLLGPSLSYWLGDDMCEKSFEVMPDFCRQMTEGLRFLHDNGVCHGDFRPGNMLLKIRNIDCMSEEVICDLLDGPDNLYFRHLYEESLPHAPEHLVKRAWWGDAMKRGIVLDEIAIVDFGEAFLEGHPPKLSGIPRVYASPEVIFKQRHSAASDVWALGASIMEVYGGSMFAEPLFRATTLLEDYLGPLPLKYRGEFEKQHREHLTDLRGHEDMCERNLLKQGLGEYVDKKKTEPSQWVLSEAQCTDPSYPVTYSSISQLQDSNKKALLKAGYDHPFALRLSSLNFGTFTGQNPRHNENFHWYLTRDEVLALTDLAVKIFRYDADERPTPVQILEHPSLKLEGKVTLSVS